MKRFLFSLIIFFALVSNFVPAQPEQIKSLLYLNQEDKDEYKKQREIWLNDMFKTPPDISWKLIKSLNKIARHEKYFKDIDNYILSGKTSKEQMLGITVGQNGLVGTWLEKGSNNQAGRIHTADVDFSSNLIYAASSGGNIWRGSLTGNGWTCLNNGLQIVNIRNVKILYIGQTKRIIVTGNGPASVWFSDNEGLTWNKSKGLDVPARWGGTYRAIFKYGTNEMYILCNEWDYERWKSITSIYLSKDNAENFLPVFKSDLPLDYCDIWTPPYDNDAVYYIHKDTLSTIKDTNVLSKSVFILNHSFGSISQSLLRGSVVDGKTILSVLYKGSNDSSYVYRSNDLINFNYIGSAPLRTFEQNSFMVSYQDTTVLFVGGVDLWKSIDNAKTWKRVNGWAEYYGNPKTLLHADIPGVMNFKTQFGGEFYLIGTDGGLYYSNDAMKTVQNISLSGLNVSQYYSGYTYRNSPGIMFLGSQDQGFQRSLADFEGPLDFEQTISGDYGHLASSDGGTNLWSVYPGFAMLYVGANNSDFQTFTWDFKNHIKNYLWMSPVIPDLDDPKTSYLLSGAPKDGNAKLSYIWKLKHNGNQITSDSLKYNFSDSTGNPRISSMAIAPTDHNLFYAATSNGEFFRSENKGDSWTKIKLYDGPDAHYLYGNSIVASEKVPGLVYIAGNGYSTPGVFRSSDFGNNWNPLDSGLPKTMVFKIAVTPDDKYIFAATQAGPYIFIADENKWYSISAPETPDQTYWSVEYLPDLKTARFVTYGRGCWDFRILAFTSIESGDNNTSLKTKMQLFPNPLRDKGELIINSNKNTISKVLLYDTDGRLIGNLYEGMLNLGINRIEIGTAFKDFILHDGSYIIFLVADGLTDFLSVKVIK